MTAAGHRNRSWSTTASQPTFVNPVAIFGRPPTGETLQRDGVRIALHRGVTVVNTIAVTMSSFTDGAELEGVTRVVRTACSHLLGNWQVSVMATAQPDRWVLRLRGAFGHHVAHFVAAPRDLPANVERCLRVFLRHVVPPLSTSRSTSERRHQPAPCGSSTAASRTGTGAALADVGAALPAA